MVFVSATDDVDVADVELLASDLPLAKHPINGFALFLIKKQLLCHLSPVWRYVPIPVTPAFISTCQRSDYTEIVIVFIKEESKIIQNNSSNGGKVN